MWIGLKNTYSWKTPKFSFLHLQLKYHSLVAMSMKKQLGPLTISEILIAVPHRLENLYAKPVPKKHNSLILLILKHLTE